jgi:hypothetical protein
LYLFIYALELDSWRVGFAFAFAFMVEGKRNVGERGEGPWWGCEAMGIGLDEECIEVGGVCMREEG